jgi:hypothetical protein
MILLYCIDCGRALEDYQYDSHHLCIICESKASFIDQSYDRLNTLDQSREESSHIVIHSSL